MTESALAQQAMQQTTQQGVGDAQLTDQRPINRLPARRMSKDSRETMNCKSCRKRKIKCNRLKPSCEACQVFKCACIYDAVPKKRGPKTDVLEALLKRVNGLEQRLKDEQQKSSSLEADSVESTADSQVTSSNTQAEIRNRPSIVSRDSASESAQVRHNPINRKSASTQPEQPAIINAILDTYFARLHDKPLYILDESATRLRLRDGRLPSFLINALHAVTDRFVPHLLGGHAEAMRSSQTHADRSRSQIDVDEPNVENLQALLLLAAAYFQSGKGKKSQMVLNHAISMAFALNLHLELPEDLRIASSEREGRRKLFWTCYLMDRFAVTGSSRPGLIGDESIRLRLPAWRPIGSQTILDGSFFTNASNSSNISTFSNLAQSGTSMLVEIVRILGLTNHYLAVGGAKGDTHFPWHAQSVLSQIRSALDRWSKATQGIFTSTPDLFGSQDSSILILSKLIYHLIHCLIYRPFLPVSLREISGSGQGQSWQLEAVNLSFLHANAITESVELGRRNAVLLDWPSFVGYCITTAGTVHVHGAHYSSYGPGDSYFNSVELLSHSMDQLMELRAGDTGIQHQNDTLQTVYACHADLVNAQAVGTSRFGTAFQMENFFDRYRGVHIDGAYVTFSDVVVPEGNSTVHSALRPGIVHPTTHDGRLSQALQQSTAGAGSSYLPDTTTDDILAGFAKKARSQSSAARSFTRSGWNANELVESRSYSETQPMETGHRPSDTNPALQSSQSHCGNDNGAIQPSTSSVFASTTQDGRHENNTFQHSFSDFHFSDPFTMQKDSSSRTEMGGDASSVEEEEEEEGSGGGRDEDPFLSLLGSLGQAELGVLGSARVLEGEGMEFDWGME